MFLHESGPNQPKQQRESQNATKEFRSQEVNNDNTKQIILPKSLFYLHVCFDICPVLKTFAATILHIGSDKAPFWHNGIHTGALLAFLWWRAETSAWDPHSWVWDWTCFGSGVCVWMRGDHIINIEGVGVHGPNIEQVSNETKYIGVGFLKSKVSVSRRPFLPLMLVTKTQTSF